MKKSKRVSRQRRAKPIVPVKADEQPERITPTMEEEPDDPYTIMVTVPMATPYIPWYVAGRSKPGEVVRVKDDQGQVQVVIIPEGGLHG